MLALLTHIHAEHELEAFSPQMNESQTTASKNEIDDSVEFASAVKTQQRINKVEATEGLSPLPNMVCCFRPVLNSEIFTDRINFIFLKHR